MNPRMILSTIEAYLQHRYPTWENIEVSNIQNMTSGWETEIIAFDLSYSRGEDFNTLNLIVRLFPGQPGVKRAQSEYKTYQILQSLDYPVPDVILVESDSKWLGMPFIMMQRIEGKTLETLLESGDEDERLHLIRDMCKLSSHLHDLDWSKGVGIPDKYFTIAPKDDFHHRLQSFRRWLSSSGAEYLLPLIDWLEMNQGNVSFEDYSIIHGDFHPMNILVDENGDHYVIDWTAARLGDYRSDLAWTMMLAYLYNEDDYWRIILQEYETAAGMKVKNIDYFLVEAAVRRFGDVLISLSRGAESLGMLEETQEEMRSTLHLLRNLHKLVEDITRLRIKEIDGLIEKYS